MAGRRGVKTKVRRNEAKEWKGRICKREEEVADRRKEQGMKEKS